MVDDFFAWAAIEHAKVRDARGPLRSAFGYVIRQKTALTRFFDDGRLRLENNTSERKFRRIATGRKYAEPPVVRGVLARRIPGPRR